MMVTGAKDVNQVHLGLLLKCRFLGPTLGLLSQSEPGILYFRNLSQWGSAA